MDGEGARRMHRRVCTGEVLIYKISGGPPIKGMITDCAPGGIGLRTDRLLTPGDIVRLLFPRRGPGETQCGRLIIGRVTHSHGEGDSRRVGIAFAWDAAVTGVKRVVHQKPARGRWFQLFSARPKFSREAADSRDQ